MTMNIDRFKVDYEYTQHCLGILFQDHNVYMTDIDRLISDTNRIFSKTLEDLGLPVTFDFSNRDNKKIYTHVFVGCFCEGLKKREPNTKLCFYSNTITKDVFRNQLIKKLKSIFGFKIFEYNKPIEDIAILLKNRDATLVPQIEVFLNQETKPKPFKKIKQYLEKSGLRFLNQEYFEDLENKILICI